MLHAILEAVIMRDIDCSCSRGFRKPAPCPPAEPPQCGYLMQQIVGSGRAYLRYERFSLCPEDLPCDARRPLQLTGVSADACGVSARVRPDPCCRGLSLLVQIPLRLCVRDACGCDFTAASRIEVPVSLRLTDPSRADCALPSAAACVRLVRPCGEDHGALDAWLDVYVEAWLTACRPLYSGPACPPPEPPLPLYPQPCRFR